MSIRIIVNGANGRMGQLAAKTIAQEPGFYLAGQTSRGDDLDLAIKKLKADIVVDFTQPESIFKTTQTIIKAGARPVIGTTGLMPPQIKKLQAVCQKLGRGGVIAPNFSVGMVLLIKYATEFVKYFPEVEIIEMHHDRKRDSPSGTALFTAESLAAARTAVKKPKEKLHEKVKGARGAKYHNIPIHAVRLPGLVAHEQIIFGDVGETLTLKHDSIDRQCFMRGVVLACKKAMKLKKLVYGLEGVL